MACRNYYFRPTIPLLLSMMAGIMIGKMFPGHPAPVAFSAVATISATICFINRSRSSFMLPVIVLATLGYLLIQPWAHPFFHASHITRYMDSQKWNIIGEVYDPPVLRNQRLTFILKTCQLERGSATVAVTGMIRVTVAYGNVPLSPGDRIWLRGKLKPFRNFNNPGGFDYKRYMKFKSVWASVYVRGDDVRILNSALHSGARRIFFRIRTRIGAVIDQSSRGNANQILRALILGQKQQLDPTLRDAFNRCGIGHVLAISGLHIGVIAMWAFLSGRWVLSRFKWFLWHAWAEKGAAVLAMIPVIMYGMLSGMSPSTQRAVIMACVFLTAICIERDNDPVNTLAVAALLILIFHPPSLFSASFQLSFSAVLAIICGMPVMIKLTKSSISSRFRFKEKLIRFAMVTVLAMAGTLPVVMWYFNQVSLIGLMVNLVVVPVIGSLIVPFGLLAVIINPFSSWVTAAVLTLCDYVLRAVIDGVIWCSKLPFAAVHTVTPSEGEIILYYVTGWAVLQTLAFCIDTGNQSDDSCENFEANFYSKMYGESKKNRLSRIVDSCRSAKQKIISCLSGQKMMLGIWAVILVAGCLDVCYYFNKRFWHDDLRVTVLDVGQGSAALLEFPDGYNMMIDGGGYPDNSMFDIGARVIAPCLWRKKINTIDTLIVSHPDSDHLNGLLYIAENFHVKTIWTNSEPSDSAGYRQLMKTIDTHDIDFPAYRDLPRHQTINNVHLDILYPPQDFLKFREQDKWRNTNNNSMVVKLSYGSVSLLFPGDIEARAEKELVRIAGKNLKSTVLLSPHHGSASSSSQMFLEQVDPDIVVVPGCVSRFLASPDPRMIGRYRLRGAEVFNTRRNGAIRLTTDSKTLKIKPRVSPSG
ncbi:MAG: ComEC/Rec2 family competence protein [Desulfobacterales bacterium]|nr:ComEC/Rec2 family competence protein [Desulfobacterales bacterium]MDD4071119.1 ComEC/Rec2 family competence protein [Desulfobacterales bacterium]MDD4393538.1 ComEC/Rec2 family competence protein [Desulfobacterales bacterium]